MHKQFFQVLKKDHQVVKSLLEQLKETKEHDSKRVELFKQLTEELVPHMKAEETAFYQPLIAKTESRSNGMEGIEEHHVAEMILKELQKIQPSEEQWTAKMSVFKEIIEHHIQEEEHKIFKSAENALDQDEIQKIMTQFEQQKQKLKKTFVNAPA